MSFPIIGQNLRTDSSFRNPEKDDKVEVEHHEEYTPLQELPIDMIESFPVSDPLHLLELGIMKK